MTAVWKSDVDTAARLADLRWRNACLERIEQANASYEFWLNDKLQPRLLRFEMCLRAISRAETLTKLFEAVTGEQVPETANKIKERGAPTE